MPPVITLLHIASIQHLLSCTKRLHLTTVLNSTAWTWIHKNFLLYFVPGWEGFFASKNKEGGTISTLVKKEVAPTRAERRDRTHKIPSRDRNPCLDCVVVFA